MKKQLTIFALCGLFGAGLTLAAQNTQDQPAPTPNDQPQSDQPKTAGHRQIDPNRQLRSLSKRLALSADQQSQILPILTDRQKQSEAILSDASLTTKDRRDKMKSIREESATKIRNLLNDNQKQEFDQMQQQMRERARERRETQQNGQSSPNS